MTATTCTQLRLTAVVLLLAVAGQLGAEGSSLAGEYLSAYIVITPLFGLTYTLVAIYIFVNLGLHSELRELPIYVRT